MRELVLTPKFKRAFRKFVKRNSQLETKIIQTLQLMQEDVFATQLGTHSLQGKLLGLRACSCGYDCRVLFTLSIGKITPRQSSCLILVRIMKSISAIACYQLFQNTEYKQDKEALAPPYPVYIDYYRPMPIYLKPKASRALPSRKLRASIITGCAIRVNILA